MPKFDLFKLLVNVFQPVKEDKVTVMVDLPHGEIVDSKEWKERRRMAGEWQEGFETLSKDYGFHVNPLATYEATGSHNRDLPLKALLGGKKAILEDIIKDSTLIVAMTEFSPTAPLFKYIEKYPRLRAASMPLCIREMEDTALGADYARVDALCQRLKKLLEPAIGGAVEFSTGHRCYFDLRFRKVIVDNGLMPPDRKDIRLVNLPSGEVFKAAYEGEKGGEESRTEGDLPVMYGKELVVYKVKNNRIVDILGDGQEATKMRKYFDEDPARRNIAEFGLGCNYKAIVRGVILEDEKAGFHWAYGRSEHIGGVCGADKFIKPANVVHYDIIYAKGSPITATSIELEYPDGTKKHIWDGTWYTV